MASHQSTQGRLDWLLWRLRILLEDTVLREFDESLVEPFLVCVALFRKALVYGEGVNVLVHEEKPEAAAPLERAIYELWLDVRFLLRSAEPKRTAQKVQIAGLLDVASYLWTRRHRFGFENLRTIMRTLREWRNDLPDLYEEVIRQRRQGRYHWSGFSRVRIEQKIAPGSMVYKDLSWQAHSVLSPLFEFNVIEVSENSVNVEFDSLYEAGSDLPWRAHTVGGMLYYMWNEMADFFGFPVVVIPGPTDSEP